MKRFLSIILAAVTCTSLIAASPLTIMAEETTEQERVIIEYDFGTDGIIDFPDYPESYRKEAEHEGTVTQVTYDNGKGEKYVNVYLPYGYEDNNDRYNVLYICHGAGGNQENFLKVGRASAVQKVFDHMFEDGVCDPFIIVSVSWRPAGSNEESEIKDIYQLTLSFAKEELSQYIIPCIDGTFRTNVDREHRAFSGFSMGGCTTWNVLMYDMKDFATFIPLSLDCWAVESNGGKSKPAETAEAIAEAIKNQGMTAEDFRIFAATSPADFAYDNLAPQMFAMKDVDMFRFGENTFFGLKEDVFHGDANARYYLYSIMQMVW